MWRVHLLGPLILLPCSKTQSPHLFPHEYSKKISRREPPWISLTVFNLVHFCLLRWKFDSIFFFLYQHTEQLFPSFYSSFFIFWRMARVPSVLLFKLNKVLMCSNFDQYFFFFFSRSCHITLKKSKGCSSLHLSLLHCQFKKGLERKGLNNMMNKKGKNNCRQDCRLLGKRKQTLEGRWMMQKCLLQFKEGHRDSWLITWLNVERH